MERRVVAIAVRTAEQARAELSGRLADRRPEIEQAALTRIHAISDPAEVADPEYLDGLRAALKAALDYGLVAIERGEERAPPLPAALLTQARIASRSNVSLDTVLRRYFAGYTLLGDFLIEEAEKGGLFDGATLKSLLRSQATLFDRLLAGVTEEYGRESHGRPTSSEERRRERIRRLLAGELVETSGLAYDFDANHLGLIAQGPEALKKLQAVAASLDHRSLVVGGDGPQAWAWIGSRRGIDRRKLERGIRDKWPTDVCLTLGEPGARIDGWRLTHQQARATLPIAVHGSEPIVRYADVAIEAAVLRDDLLAVSLRQLYLAPLEGGKDNGEVLRRTLRTYFSSDRNVSSAAAVLGISRQAVTKRICQAEVRLMRSVAECGMGLELALRVDAVDCT